MIPKVAVILTDSNKKIIWVNNDFSEITGYSLREVVGRKPSLLQGPKSDASIIARMRRCLEEQIPFKDAITNYRKNGEEYLCKLVIYPIFNEDHQLLHFIAFEVDGDKVLDESKIPLMQLSEKYTSSSLRGLDEMKLYYQLQKLLEEEKLYLNPDLSLRQLADRLATNTKYLSQVVNHLAGNNFQYYLNTFRIKEVKDKILDTQYGNLTLFGIALQCGFKNKSTFYKVFKEIIGLTPKEYIRKHQ
ncbi:MAG: PAS domain-containing protein [Bacteroidota bacterium]